MTSSRRPTIADLYPALSPEEQAAAATSPEQLWEAELAKARPLLRAFARILLDIWLEERSIDGTERPRSTNEVGDEGASATT